MNGAPFVQKNTIQNENEWQFHPTHWTILSAMLLRERRHKTIYMECFPLYEFQKQVQPNYFV